MTYKSETYKRVGNGKMGSSLKELASSCDLTVSRFIATGWVLKDITIEVYGHADDIARFEKQLPAGIQS